MQLFADRFVLGRDKVALDLATGARVAFTVAPAGDEAEQRRWVLACDRARHYHHPTIPRLIDYGVVGDARRFEARSLDSVATPSARLAPGIELTPRRAVSALAELFEHPQEACPLAVVLWGPPGAGKRSVVADLARIARLNGVVPVAAHLLDEGWAEALDGRTLLVVDTEGRRRGWRGWLRASIGVARPHVLLVVAQHEARGMDGVGLEPMSPAALVGAVRFDTSCEPRAEHLRRLAEQSGGWPGRFARLLWRGRLERRSAGQPVASTTRLRAAEQSAVYGVDEPPAPVRAIGGGAWPAPGEIASLRRRIEAGIRLVSVGRLAPGERALRSAIAALARRHEWTHAGDGGTALATLLLTRGRPRDAQQTLAEAADCWKRAGDEARLVDVAVMSGRASIELARPADAEATLEAAVATARSLADGKREGRALAMLARALFWRARFTDAEQALDSIERTRPAEPEAIAVAGLAAAVAVGTKQLDRAVSRATDGLARAQGHGGAHLVAGAAVSAAFAHLAVLDLAAVERDVAVSVAAARACHEPLLAVEGRLLQAEALRRAGHPTEAQAVLHRLSPAGASRLPPLLRARCDLLRDLLAGDAGDEVTQRHVAQSGLGALVLFGAPRPVPANGGILDPTVAGLVDVLGLCQKSEDEQTVLREVCRRVRVLLHAAAVACVAGEGGRQTVVASDGGRVDLDIADRAVQAGLTLAPRRREDRIEAAAAIHYGGAPVGAIVARWTIGASHGLGPSVPLLTAVAAAVAPIVSAAMAGARRARLPVAAGLMGASPAMEEVRRGVERAALAPFAVLIEGESGSGKELVARALHQSGPRRQRPFCTLNCAALPDDLVESELFGHARGSFTGAVAERTGVFEEAHGGTLLLDEIGELSPRAQAKLLRVIQEGELRRIGENVSRRIDVRIVAATNRELRQEVAAGRFRLDLLYRLDVVRLVVPPLRDRREDIPGLAEHFWREATAKVGSRATLGPATLASLARYDWPGNVRELQNVLASLAVRSQKRGVVTPSALGPQFGESRFAETARLEEARRAFEERFVRAALVRSGGHRTRAAAELGVTRQGLTKLMNRLGIGEKR